MAFDDPGRRVVEGTDPDVFAAIIEPEVGAAVWTRPSPIQDREFPAWARPAKDEFTALPPWLSADMIVLRDQLTHLGLGHAWRFTLETVTTRACPRFHQDALKLRLITAYRGPGVELATADDPDTVLRIPTGSAVLLKGSRWPGVPKLLHRSPPARRSRPRWLLVMDLVD
ncbi:DUF1826 domain-containing protein [Phenylobacterium sp.]|jgi:hypothetical protein|uniref:DUF1826 domain-containing protein n=1 Tax=Phenylobacterium sp. TaxID=1871053 RepID=UPI0037C9B962